jgi:glucosamine-6-phosphate deaminase
MHVDSNHNCAASATSIASDIINDARIATIGLATGRSVESFYVHLLQAHYENHINLSPCHFLMLDEYIGLPPGDNRLFKEQLESSFLSNILNKTGHFIYPDSSISDQDKMVQQFATKSGEFNVNLQILGIGRNGHLGFNEPGSTSTSVTRVVELSQSTLNDLDAVDWQNTAEPRYAVTRGLADIIASETIFLFAFGVAKAPALRSALAEPSSDDCPASVLQNHSNVHVFADDDAASLL